MPIACCSRIGDPGHSKTAEGAFYIWTKKEIEEALGDAAEVFEIPLRSAAARPMLGR